MVERTTNYNITKINNKKVFVPSKKDLYIMQDLGVNIYNYLICKAIDTLVLENPKGSILKEYKEYDRDIVEFICKIYPEETKNIAKYYRYSLSKIATDLVNKSNDTSVTTIDNLVALHDKNIVLQNIDEVQILDSVINRLALKLPLMPEYRYEYKEPNIWLDTIFSGNVIKWLEERYCNLSFANFETKKKLSEIEPYYALKDYVDYGENYLLTKGITAYLKRYGMTNYYNQDYIGNCNLDNPNNKVKTLSRIINKSDSFK